ncbi:hypothetical protein KQ940_17045 [Marinobacterium sp. D7]|uniref:hypothetical protein n=1 Tax=Marinobacterium ramblicola TaxID=2849041 RepID=UPI001C2D7EDD|nr:hypothetical protein [Marinobacterium ramblicola]MBV1789764.1 hypothetical protein [Marinobacterium ramblicola]
MQTERILQRIETYTADLPQAVQSSNGARFAMLLSLIASNQELYSPVRQPASGDGSFELLQESLSYPDPNEFYTELVVDRLNRSVNAGQRGEYAYLISHVDTQAHTPRQGRIASDSFEQVALASSGRMMIDLIDRSRHSIEVHA